MNLPQDFVFSQSSLQDYVDCPRRFELRYLKHLRWPAVQAEPVEEHERLMAQGADFHHLIHQYLSGIPAETLAQHIPDATLRGWWDNFRTTVAEHLHGDLFPETTLTVPLGNYLLTARYDLLALGERALIFDWKTSRKRPTMQWLAGRMQTLVYRYVLAAAHQSGPQAHPAGAHRHELLVRQRSWRDAHPEL